MVTRSIRWGLHRPLHWGFDAIEKGWCDIDAKIRVGLEILLALVIIGLAVEYHRSEVRAASAEASQQARDEADKQSAKQIQSLSDQIKQIQIDNKAQVLALTQTVALLKTPQQQIQWSQDQLAQALKGITITLDSKGQAIATIPAATVPELPQVIEKCQTCQLNLDSTTKQLSYSQQQQQLLAGQLVNITKERDDWKRSANGGSWIKRFGKAAEYLGIGAAVGYIAGHHN